MFHRFRYEAEFYPSLSRLPLYVRMKLDLAGIRLSLKDWLAFSIAERQAVCHLPVESQEERETFTVYLDFLCHKYRGDPVEMLPPMSGSLWDASRIPTAVIERSATSDPSVTLLEWSHWKFHERYALYKTAISKSEPEKFHAVLAELRERQQ
jgi:hypothetical protein